MEGGTEMGIRLRKNFRAKNVTIRNLVLSPDEAADSFVDAECPQDAVAELSLENIRVQNVKNLFRGFALRVNGLTTDDPKESFVTEEHARLASAYGRYFHSAYGKVFENRPPDSRFREKNS